jgi:hypothetical protein
MSFCVEDGKHIYLFSLLLLCILVVFVDAELLADLLLELGIVELGASVAHDDERLGQEVLLVECKERGEHHLFGEVPRRTQHHQAQVAVATTLGLLFVLLLVLAHLESLLEFVFSCSTLELSATCLCEVDLICWQEAPSVAPIAAIEGSCDEIWSRGAPYFHLFVFPLARLSLLLVRKFRAREENIKKT